MEAFFFREHGIQDFAFAVSSFIPPVENSRIPDPELHIFIPAPLLPISSFSVTFDPFREIPSYTYQEERGNSFFCTIRFLASFLKKCCMKLIERVRIAVNRKLNQVPGGDIQIANCQFAL